MDDESKRRSEAWADAVLLLRGRAQDAKALGDPVKAEPWIELLEFAEKRKHSAWLDALSENEG